MSHCHLIFVLQRTYFQLHRESTFEYLKAGYTARSLQDTFELKASHLFFRPIADLFEKD